MGARARKAKIDTVRLPEATLAVLRRFWNTQGDPRLLLPNGNGKDASAWVARSLMDRGGVQTVMAAARQFWLIHKHFTIRSLRHAYVTHLLKRGVNLRSIQVVVGHESPETIDHYTHLTTVNQQQAKDRIQLRIADFVLRWEEGQ